MHTPSGSAANLVHGLEPTERRALRAVGTQFFVNGLLSATVYPRLPEVRDQVGLTISSLGWLLAVAAVGGFVASAAVSGLIKRFGTRKLLIFSAIAVLFSLPLVGFATVWPLLLIGLLAITSFDVFVDVSMNMQGSWLSAKRSSPVMNRLHGLWSMGTVFGGLIAVVISRTNLALGLHLSASALIMLFVVTYVGSGLLKQDRHPQVDEPADKYRSGANTKSGSTLSFRRVLWLLAIAGFSAVVLEVSGSDWAAFRLTDDFGSTASFGAAGYVGFTSGMMTARLLGDWAIVRLGSSTMLSLAALLSAAGTATAALAPNRYITICGFVVAGLGVATLLPAIYDRAAQLSEKPGAGLGALTGGIRLAAVTTPLLVTQGAELTGGVGFGMALVALPCAVVFFVVARLLD